MPRTSNHDWERFLLWVDAVGGYLICSKEQIVLGQPSSVDEGDSRGADIPIFANLSRRHARIIRDGEEYVVEALRSTYVNDTPIDGAAALRDGDLLRLGEALLLEFRRPHPLSLTASLTFRSSHRTQPSVRAILLMAGTCVLGPQADSHVVCRDWSQQVMLSLQDGRLRCRGPEGIEVDGRAAAKGRATLSNHSRVRWAGASFSVEQFEG